MIECGKLGGVGKVTGGARVGGTWYEGEVAVVDGRGDGSV